MPVDEMHSQQPGYLLKQSSGSVNVASLEFKDAPGLPDVDMGGVHQGPHFKELPGLEVIAGCLF